MGPSALEVADIFRRLGPAYRRDQADGADQDAAERQREQPGGQLRPAAQVDGVVRNGQGAPRRRDAGRVGQRWAHVIGARRIGAGRARRLRAAQLWPSNNL